MDKVSAEFVAEATIYADSPAYKLHSREAAAGKLLKGLSGGPVLAQPSSVSGLQVVVGVVRWNQPAKDGTPVGGAFYVTRIRDVLARWPRLQTTPADRVPLPSSTAIRHFLYEYVDPEKNTPFGGRDREISAILNWIHDPNGTPVYLVTGPSGRGKSALVAQCWKAFQEAAPLPERAVFVPITIRYNLSRDEPVLRAAAARLAMAQDQDWAKVADTIPGRLSDLFAELLESDNPNSQPLLLVLDGLDEMQGWDVYPGFIPADRCTPNVRILLSARETEDRPTPAAWQAALGLAEHECALLHLESLEYAAILSIIQSMQPVVVDSHFHEEAAQTLLELTAGDALTLSLYLRDLQRSSDSQRWLVETADSDAPPGLAGYLQRWWADQETLWDGPLGSRARHVSILFGLLSCAFGPISRRALLQLSRHMIETTGDDLDAALSDLRRWIVVVDDAGNYSVSHPRIAESRRAELERSLDLQGYQTAYTAWGADVVGRLMSAALAPSEVDTYLLRHLGQHLQVSSSPARDYTFLASELWYAALQHSEGDVGRGYLQDLANAREAIARDIERDIERNDAAALMNEFLACVEAAARARQGITAIPLEVVPQLVRHRVWTDAQALEYCERMLPGYERTQVLAVLGPWLSSAMTAELEANCFDPLSHGSQSIHDMDLFVGYLLHLAHNNRADDALKQLHLSDLSDSKQLDVELQLAPELVGDHRLVLLSDIMTRVRRHPWRLSSVSKIFSMHEAMQALGVNDRDEFLNALLDGISLTPESTAREILDYLERVGGILYWLEADATVLELLPGAIAHGEKLVRKAGELERAVIEVRMQKERAIDAQDFVTAADLRDSEKAILTQLYQLADSPAKIAYRFREALARLKTAAQLRSGWELDRITEIALKIENGSLADADKERLHIAELVGGRASALDSGQFMSALRELDSLDEDSVAAVFDSLTEPDIERAFDLIQADTHYFSLDRATVTRLLVRLASMGPDQARAALGRIQARADWLPGANGPLLERHRSIPENHPGQRRDGARQVIEMIGSEPSERSWKLMRCMSTFRDSWMRVETALCFLEFADDADQPNASALLSACASNLEAHLRSHDLIEAATSASTHSVMSQELADGAPEDLVVTVGLLGSLSTAAPCPMSLDEALEAVLVGESPALSRTQEIIRGNELYFYPRVLATIVEQLPLELRHDALQRLIPALLPGNFNVFFGFGPWSERVTKLVPIIDMRTLIEFLRSADNLRRTSKLKSRPYSRIYSAAAMRFSTLGDSDRALGAVVTTTHAEDSSTALGAIGRALPASYLPNWIDVVMSLLGDPRDVAERLMVWASLWHRWTNVSRSAAWDTLRRWANFDHADTIGASDDIRGLQPLIRVIAERRDPGK